MRSAWLLPGGTEPGQTREDTRLSPLGTFTPETELRTRSGVLAGGDPFAATGAGAMALQVGAGRAVVQGTDAQGAYPVCLDAPAVLTFDDGAAQFTRIDSVVARVYDGLYDTEGQTLAQVERITGEAAAEPSPPVLPSGCLRLWDVAVPAGTSAGVGGIDWGVALTDRRQYTAAHGGIVPRGAASDAGAYDGQYRDAAGVLERWTAADDVWETYRPPSLPVGREVAAYKPTATTRSNTARSDDPHLVLALEANAVYAVDGYFVVRGSEAGDINVDWSRPSGSTGWWTVQGMPVPSTGGDAEVRLVATEWGAGGRTYGIITAATSATVAGLIRTGGSGGTLALSWAQGTDTGSTILEYGSWLRARRIA